MESLAVGGSHVFEARVTDRTGGAPSAAPIAWSSSNPDVISIGDGGVATGVGAGSAFVVASVGGAADSAKVHVTEHGALLQLVPAAASMVPGDEITIAAELGGVAGTAPPAVSWSSTDTTVILVSSTGVITAVGPGRAQIHGTLGGSVARSLIEVIPARIAQLQVAPVAASLPVGSTQRFSVTALSPGGRTLRVLEVNTAGDALAPEGEHETGGARVVSWSSSNPGILAVDGSGTATALRPGHAVIRAVASGQTGVARVKVSARRASKVASIAVDADASLHTGETTQAHVTLQDSAGHVLETEPVSWYSADTTVATVSSTGLITAVDEGSSQIIASSGGTSATLTLSVTATAGAVASVKVALSAGSVPAGGTSQATVTVRDASGNLLTGKTVSWSLTKAGIATITAGGLVTGVAVGEVGVRATVDGISGVAWLHVTSGGAVITRVVVRAPSTTLTVGGTMQATATFYDAGGATVNGTATWSSTNPAVAKVSKGLISALAAGSATIRAKSPNGVIGSLGLTVTTGSTAPVATVTVSLAASTIAVGQSTQATAVARDASGNVLPNATIAFSSSNTAVATVSGAGTVLAHSAGTAIISATAGGKVGSAPLTVQAASPPPPGSIALTIRRFDGLSGATLVSNAIPLVRGALMPSQTSNLRLYVNGIEQSLYVEATAGRHSDGSLRTVLVQFNHNVPATGSLSGNLVLGQSRQTTDLPKPGFNRTSIAAVALPTDPNYLVSTELNGPTITVAQSSALGAPFTRYENDFVTYANKHWIADGDIWSNANYYDRALVFYAFWVRSGDPVLFYRATRIAVNYRVNYLEANKYATSPHWSQVEGLEQHYLLTGDQKSQFAVARVAEQMKGYPLADTTSTAWMESRIQARALQAIFTAWRINAIGPANLNLPQLLDGSLTKVLSTQRADGSIGWPVTCDFSLNYMNGLLNDVLIKIHTYYRADSRIVPFVKKNADYLWAKEWLSGNSAFKYITNHCTSTAGYVGGPTAAPDLNGLIVTAFGWLSQQTGNSSYRTAGDAIFKGGVNGTWLPGSKQFNQQYSATYRYLAYRR